MAKRTKRNVLYKKWHNMIERCHKPNHQSYKWYGAKGRSVCDEWRNSFEAFYEWSLNNGYELGLSIERNNNNGNYEPDNCSWVTMPEQLRNKSTNVKFTYDGRTMTIAEWARELNIPDSTLRRRFNDGLREEQLLKEAFVHVKVNGESKTFAELSQETGINEQTLRSKYRNAKLKGINFEDVLDVREVTKIEFKGEFKTFSELSKESGVETEVLRKRYKKGLREDKLVEIIKEQTIEFRGEQKTFRELADEFKIESSTIRKRYNRGTRGEDLVVPNKRKKLNNDNEQLRLPL